MREAPSGGLGTHGGADSNWQREWGTQVQRYETGKGKMCSGNCWFLRGCSGQSLGSTEGKQGGMGLGLREKIGLQGAIFHESLDFTL